MQRMLGLLQLTCRAEGVALVHQIGAVRLNCQLGLRGSLPLACVHWYRKMSGLAIWHVLQVGVVWLGPGQLQYSRIVLL